METCGGCRVAHMRAVRLRCQIISCATNTTSLAASYYGLGVPHRVVKDRQTRPVHTYTVVQNLSCRSKQQIFNSIYPSVLTLEQPRPSFIVSYMQASSHVNVNFCLPSNHVPKQLFIGTFHARHTPRYARIPNKVLGALVSLHTVPFVLQTWLATFHRRT